MTTDSHMEHSFTFEKPKENFQIKYTFPQLCAKCGQYSGERHKYCLMCVEKIKRNPTEKTNDDAVVDIFTYRTPRKKRPRNFRLGGSLLDHTCPQCKSLDKPWYSSLCLKCEESRKELPKSRDTIFTLKAFEKGELLSELSQSDPSLATVGRRKDLKCIVCRKRSTQEPNQMCQKCTNKSKQYQPVGRFYKEIAKHIREAISVKEEFIRMEPIRGLINWEISYNARRESLKHLLNNLVIMRPHNREERQKQEEAMYQVKSFIDHCTIHFERLKVRGVKYEKLAL